MEDNETGFFDFVMEHELTRRESVLLSHNEDSENDTRYSN